MHTQVFIGVYDVALSHKDWELPNFMNLIG